MERYYEFTIKSGGHPQQPIMKFFSYIRYFFYIAYNWNIGIAWYIIKQEMKGEKKLAAFG